MIGGLFVYSLFFTRCRRCALHDLHIQSRRDAACVAAFHAVMDVGVFRRDLGAALPQGFLYDTQVFGLLIEVRTAAVTEEVACIAGLLEPRLGERLVDNVADADA